MLGTDIEVTTRIDLPTLIEAVAYNTGISPIKFILCVNDDIADQGFTLQLVKKLVEDLRKDEEEAEERLYAMMLKQEFCTTVDEELKYIPKNVGERYEEARKYAKTFSAILKLLDDLHSPGNWSE